MRRTPRKRDRPAQLSAGHVTGLKARANSAAHVRVFVDEAFAFGLHRDIVVREGLTLGQRLTVAQQEVLIAQEQHLSARELAMKYLSYGPRTRHEVRARLQRANVDKAMIDEVVRMLSERGYLDDAAYANEYVCARFKHRGHGPYRLRSDLEGRGIAQKHIVAALAVLDADFEEAARRHAVKHWPRVRGKLQERKKKLSDYLLRRGFAYDTVQRAVDRIAAQEAHSDSLS